MKSSELRMKVEVKEVDVDNYSATIKLTAEVVVVGDDGKVYGAPCQLPPEAEVQSGESIAFKFGNVFDALKDSLVDEAAEEDEGKPPVLIV